MDNLLYIMVIVACLILEGLYSGGEIAFISADINRIRLRAKKGRRNAALTLALMKKPEIFLATTLTGTNLAIVTSTTLATAMLIAGFGPLQGELFSLLLMIPTLMIMILSRSLFQQYSEVVAIKIGPFIRLSSWLLWPVVQTIAGLSRGAVRLSSQHAQRSDSYITRDGLKYLLGQRGSRSDIKGQENYIVQNIIDFSGVTVGKIMAPLSTVTALPVTTPLQEAAAIAAEKKYLRLPVYQDQIFNIIGILHYFDLLEVIKGASRQRSPARPDDTVACCLRPAVFYVPETKPAKELLIEMKLRKEQMAIVVDEYGGAVGLVTLEDILEEIVGEIHDEYDSGEKMYKRISPGRYLFHARANLDMVRHLLPITIPGGDYETIGGYLLYRMGRIPRRKETLLQGNVLFVIEDADAKAVREIMVIFPSELDGAAGA